MPTVRYYDYGVMRMQSEQRLLDAQRRSADQWEQSYKRVTPSINTQTRSAAESLPTCQQNAPECDESVCKCVESETRRECGTHSPSAQCAQPQTCGQKMPSSEELLIIALLLLALSEGGSLPLVLALLYLLM